MLRRTWGTRQMGPSEAMRRKMRLLRGPGASFALALVFAVAAVCTLPAQDVQPAAPSSSIPSIVIVGDSTANIHGDPDVSTKRRVGWGTPFAAYFNLAKI